MGTAPNIVVIMTDQQRWETVGAYGAAPISTPHLDALAAGGALFDGAFVPIPLCTPSRASLFTGQYPTRHGIRGNNTQALPEGTPNLLATLRAAGYSTHLAGKDHLFTAEQRAEVFDSVTRYDHFGRVEGEGEVDPRERAVRATRLPLMPAKWTDREPHDLADCPTVRITEAAIATVGAARADGRPFFLWLSYPDPHPPYLVPEPYASLYRDRPLPEPAARAGELDNKPLRQRVTTRLMGMPGYSAADLRRLREIYYGMVTLVDDQVGRFLTHLDEAGLRDDTIVVFMSDHGDYLGDHGMVRKSPTLYDCLVRIPLIISWPGRLAPTRLREALVESIDLAPTLLELADLPAPAGMDGRSLVPLLTGRTTEGREAVFGVYGTEGAPYTAAEVAEAERDGTATGPRGIRWFSPLVARGQMAMLRGRRWKLIYYQGGEGELYDLACDPGELENRYDDPACGAVRAELTVALLDRLLASLPTRSAQLGPADSAASH